MPSLTLDKTDLRILAELQLDGRLTNVELAERVALSPSPCLRRLKQLEESGVIRQYVALLDPAHIGLGLQAGCASRWRSAATCTCRASSKRCRTGRK